MKKLLVVAMTLTFAQVGHSAEVLFYLTHFYGNGLTEITHNCEIYDSDPLVAEKDLVGAFEKLKNPMRKPRKMTDQDKAEGRFAIYVAKDIPVEIDGKTVMAFRKVPIERTVEAGDKSYVSGQATPEGIDIVEKIREICAIRGFEPRNKSERIKPAQE